MGASAPRSRDLKALFGPKLAAMLAFDLAAFYVAAFAGQAAAFNGDLSRLGAHAVPPLLLTVVSGVLNNLISSDMKARLVFWRWHHPLPGSIAFSEIGPKDARVDIEAIRRVLGEFPTDPSDQNRAWYKMYLAVRDLPSVQDSHRAFLLNRDLAAQGILAICALGPLSLLLIRPWSAAWLFLVLLVGQYLVIRIAAADRGRRFVAQVLAETGAKSVTASRASTTKGAAKSPKGA